tara:strand:+ start:7354 stop:8340 length:987 start_codon:yes stop_codon:yes gene_type:complete
MVGMSTFWPSQQHVPLGQQSPSDMRRIAAMSQVPLHDLQAMADTQGQLEEVSTMHHIEIPKVNFFPSRHHDPKKARRKDIKQAYRLLKPTKRTFLSPLRIVGGKFRYNSSTTHCCIDGCDVDALIRAAGNLYDDIRDEETGKSLWELYFHNSVTGESEAFIARENVTSGRKMRGTYCPEHLHLYHLLNKWEREEEREREASTGTLRAKLKKGVTTVSVPVVAAASFGRKKDNTPMQLAHYEEFFKQAKRDNLPIIHMQNHMTGQNDIVMVVFDMRQFQSGTNARILSTSNEMPPQASTQLAASGPTLQSLLASSAPPAAQLPDVPAEE